LNKYYTLLTFISLLHANVPKSLSFQGYTGIINVPNAEVLEENSFIISFNNHFDNHLRFYDKTKIKNKVYDSQFGIGLFKNLEIFGRFKEQKGYARDLSGNIKYKLPKIFNFVQNIAIGAQDLGGKFNYYKAYYIVADKKFKNLRISLGYGYGKNKSAKRLNGIFGGIEYAFNPYIIGAFDYDGKEKHIAIKTLTPKKWLNGINLETMIAKNLNDNSYSFSLSTKFFLDYHNKIINKNNIIDKNLSKKEAIDYLFNSLKNMGFNQIDIYKNNKYIVIKYNNNIYRNDVDAIYNIIKRSFILHKYYDYIILESTKSGIIKNKVLVNLKKAIHFYKHPSKIKNFITNFNLKDQYFKLVKSTHNKKLHLEIIPILKTFVGTEVSPFDYQFLIGFNSYYNITKGLDISAEYDTKNSVTGVFADSYNNGGLNNALIHYSNKYKHIINTLSIGLYRYEYLGFINQTSLLYKNNYFNLKIGYFKHNGRYKHIDWQDNKKIFIADYNYYFKSIDASIDIYGGQFWNQDRGFGINLNKYMGDITISLKYFQSKPTTYWKFNKPESINRYVGLYLTIPLDFKKNKTNFKYIQLHGNKNFQYGLRSTIKRNDGTNQILPGSGDIVKLSTFEHNNYFYDNKRSNIYYIQNQRYRIFY